MREGRFSWDGAPDEPRNFCFLKRGYQSKRGQTLRPGEENMVVLHTDRTIQGWVVDAKTEKPITKFKVSVGRRRGDSFNANWPGMREYIDPNGAFSITAGEEGRNAVKVEADEYEEQLADLPKDNQDVTSLTFKLKPSASVRAILVDTQGMPVAGASVALCEDSPVSLIRLEKGRLTAYNSGNRKITTTGEDGRFTLPSKDGAILAASTRDGFGSASIDEVRNTGRLVLQEFGRIEGTIQVAGAPMAGQELMWSLSQIGIMPDQDFAKTTSDEQGRFVFEKVPAR